jgi:curved DNA-binding protein CbpA
MGKDYYLVLGVRQDATLRRIRDAFRELALRHHPDRAGAQSTRHFQDIVEAYEALSDPVQRAAHDAALRRVDPSPAPARRKIVDMELRLSRREAAEGLRLRLHPRLPTRVYLPGGLWDGDVLEVALEGMLVRLHVRIVQWPWSWD